MPGGLALFITREGGGPLYLPLRRGTLTWESWGRRETAPVSVDVALVAQALVAEAGDAQLVDVDRVGATVEDLLGDQQAGRGGLHHAVAAETARIDVVRQVRVPPEDRHVVR